MGNSIKQLFRTPFKLVLFLILLAAGTALLMVGSALWMKSAQQLKKMEEIFTTIGTVTQRETRTATYDQWDAALQEYVHWTYPAYDTVLPESILEFEGAEYLKGPEKRPYYGALLQDCERTPVNTEEYNFYLFIEFSPVEDCVPTQPVLVDIKKVLWGDDRGSKTLWFCDHFTENPAPLEAGKTYIAGLQYQANTHLDVQVPSGLEFTPWFWPESTQTDGQGIKLDSDMNMPDGVHWEEVTDGFYETARGKGWLSLIERQALFEDILPVLPTESCSLLPSFHEREATMSAGREISEEEFQSGALVCMVPEDFAKHNSLEVGDSLQLPLFFANYRTSPGFTFGYNFGAIDFSLANTQGDVYPVFWDAAYEIVGIYRYQGPNPDQAHISELGRDTVIIPSKSVQASDEQNIADFGPMLAYTTSFQIPNGSVAAFDSAFQKSGAGEFLEISYDDNGYEQIAENLRQTGSIAALLCMAGMLSAMIIILLLLYFFIVKQKKRTAIERGLGMSRRQCRVSLIGGIMGLAVVAVVLGSGVGLLAANQMESLGNEQESAYSTEFSSWVTEEANGDLASRLATEGAALPLAAGISAFLLLFTLTLSVILVNRNLKTEPILLLSQREE